MVVPTRHNFNLGIVIACVVLSFVFGIGILVFFVYLLYVLTRPENQCIYCKGEVMPAPPAMYYPNPAPYPVSPPPPAYVSRGKKHCPGCYTELPVDASHCYRCGRMA